jgi:ribosomal protein S18 acetylase RimI-like enzyme
MRIRRATLADLEAVADLLEVRSRAALGSSEASRDELARWWAVQPGVDRWVAEDGGVTGYAALSGEQAFEIAAAPAEVNDALLETVVVRARERGFDAVHALVVPEDEPLDALVRRAGFEHRGDVLRMWRALDGELPAPRWPDGVSVRAYDAADGPAVKRLLDEAYSAWDESYVVQSQDDWQGWMTGHEEFDPALWFLVERDGELVACALYWKEERRRGWLKDLVVRESERGHGLGTALVRHGLRAYAERGADRVGLKVDSTNPTGAPALYERVGFVTDRRWGTWHRQV